MKKENVNCIIAISNPYLDRFPVIQMQFNEDVVLNLGDTLVIESEDIKMPKVYIIRKESDGEGKNIS